MAAFSSPYETLKSEIKGNHPSQDNDSTLPSTPRNLFQSQSDSSPFIPLPLLAPTEHPKTTLSSTASLTRTGASKLHPTRQPAPQNPEAQPSPTAPGGLLLRTTSTKPRPRLTTGKQIHNPQRTMIWTPLPLYQRQNSIPRFSVRLHEEREFQV